MDGVERAEFVNQVKVDGVDFAGNRISCLYAYAPPRYAVYRTLARVMVHFSDNADEAIAQRARIASLTPLRGQISSLIDGWHNAADRWWMPWSKDHPLRKRAIRYDRRTADAIVLALDNADSNSLATSQALLAEIKNDIISERTSMARSDYLRYALLLVLLLMAFSGLATQEFVRKALESPATIIAVWTAVSGGALGAFFSIAIGLKSRTVLIDLQNRDNHADALLRMLIGAIAGGMLLCLLLSGLISDVIEVEQMTPGDRVYKPLLVFVIGFLGGFFERLVPDLLSQTNLGTTEQSSGTAATTPSGGPAPTQRPSGEGPLPGPATPQGNEEPDAPPDPADRGPPPDDPRPSTGGVS